MKNALIFIIAIVLAAAAGYATQQYLATEQDAPAFASKQTDAVIGSPRPEFAMQDINGKIRNIKDWDGKVILLNFWATLCPPCRKEMPGFVELQKEYGDQGLQIIGIAMDNEQSVRVFAKEIQVNYPLMAGDTETIELAKRYGDTIGALPFTAIINRKGEISSTFAGELSKSRALESLKKAGL